MLKHPSLDQLHALGLHGMAKAFVDIAATGEADGLGHHEWLGLLLDREVSWRQDKRLAAGCAAAKCPSEASGMLCAIRPSDYPAPAHGSAGEYSCRAAWAST